MSREDEVRAAIVAEAITWERTPFHHEARVKGHGVDCAMMPAEVYHAVGLIERFEPKHYPSDWMLNNSDELYMGIVRQFAVEAPAGYEPKPGDFILWKYGLCFAHGMIVISWPLCIHAQWRENVQRIDVSVDMRFRDRERKVFTLAESF